MIDFIRKKLAGRKKVLPLVGLAVVFGACLIFPMLFGAPARPDAPASGQPAAQVWTCSMHPQIRLDHPGQCPICGMDLVPVTESVGAVVETAPVESRLLWKELRTVGKVQLDETVVTYITARVDGRVDRVFADFPGTVVAEGDHLVWIYSPDLLATQQELLLNLKLEHQRPPGPGEPSPTQPTRERLLLWGITEAQIEQLARTGQRLTHLTVFSPMAGTIIEKDIRAGQYVATGDRLYTIADLGRVWVVIDVYERELAWVRFGQPVELSLESQPGRTFVGAVGFIEPVLNEETRTVRVRVMLENPEGHFKPGMFVEALLRVPLQPDGSPGPTGLEGKYACPMHPFVVQDGPGACRICGMALDRVPGERGEPGPVLSVPAEAVLTTGRRQVVYVEDEPGVYRLVQPVLGPRAGDHYPVLGGLSAGQRVATRGNFLLDSQAQISGKPSLLYPAGGVGGGHAGHGGLPGMAPPGAQGAPGTEGPEASGGHDGHAPGPPAEPAPPPGHEAHEPLPPSPPATTTTSPPPPPDEHRGHQRQGD